jgi:hypothetical protein
MTGEAKNWSIHCAIAHGTASARSGSRRGALRISHRLAMPHLHIISTFDKY